MTSGPAPSLREQEVRGMKYLDRVFPLLRRLHDVGCQRDKAGNRDLHMDEYCALMLLFLFSPSIRSLRTIQRASELRKVQKLLGCGRASLGSLSEAVQVFEPQRLEAIIVELGAELLPHARDERLANIRQTITLVDGTLLPALSRIAEAMWLSTQSGTRHYAWRLHTHFALDRHVPVRMDLTNGKNSGPSNEKNVLRQHLAADHLYVMDRGYAQFSLFDDIVAAQSSYVCRVRDNSRYQVLQEQELSAAAQQAGVVLDAVVALGDPGDASRRPTHPVRLVMVQVQPHEKRSNRKGNTGAGPSDGYLRIVTNLLDVPAEIIALLYQYRYTIELFFRFFKHLLGCRHLLSDKPDGIRIQVYCAIIACLLLSLWTGRKPTQATLEMFYWYFLGLAEEDELETHLAKLKLQPA
ncbi:MAG TPA: IS4 family transposase [Bryobacteraceae bacterium]|nr:IS4 family transposase [Bryobacteraceae bacterium]